VKGRPVIGLAIVVLVFAVLAAPAPAAQGTEDLPTELWNPLPDERAAPDGSSDGISPLLALTIVAIATGAGVLVGELTPAPRARRMTR
jgi:hypothetical protein